MTNSDDYEDQLDMLTGILVPESKAIANLDLYTFDEEKYLILEDDVTSELLTCLFKKIEVRGDIDIDREGRKTLCPHKWKVIENPTDVKT